MIKLLSLFSKDRAVGVVERSLLHDLGKRKN